MWIKSVVRSYYWLTVLGMMMISSIPTVSSAATGAPTTLPNLVAVKFTNTGNGHVQLQYFTGDSGFRYKAFNNDAALYTHGSAADLELVDWDHDGIPDLALIMTSGTASGKIEVAIVSGASAYQTYILSHVITPIPVPNNTNYNFQFIDWDHDNIPDLAVVNKQGAKAVTVEILSGAKTFTADVAPLKDTAFAPAGSQWHFSFIDRDRDGIPDLVGVTDGPTASLSKEASIVSGASNFQTSILHTGTPISQNISPFQYQFADWNADGNFDLFALLTQTGSTTVDILSGASAFQTFLRQGTTPLPPFDSSYKLLITPAHSILPPAPHIKHVFLIMMENHNWTSIYPSLNIKGNTNAPYINKTLLVLGAHAENYVNIANMHPSKENYLWLEAGSNLGVTDGLAYVPTYDQQTTTDHLVTDLQKVGHSWMAYNEYRLETDPCHLSEWTNPMEYFTDITANSANCTAHFHDYSELVTNLNIGTNIADYNLITPNLCDSMHDSCSGQNPIAQGDTWLKNNIPLFMNSPVYPDSVIFILFDESASGDWPIPLIVLSPFAKPGYSNTVRYTHSSMLRTNQMIFDTFPYLRDAANAQDLGDLFQQFP